MLTTLKFYSIELQFSYQIHGEGLQIMKLITKQKETQFIYMSNYKRLIVMAPKL